MRTRTASTADIPRYLEIVAEVWPEHLGVAEEKVRERMRLNPLGVIAAEHNGRLVGMATAIRLTEYDFDHPMSWSETTADGWCSTHDPRGAVAFGVDLTVSETDAPSGTVDALAAAQGRYAVRSGVKYYVFGERLPKYHLYADRMTVDEYVTAKDSDGRYLDPQVGMYQRIPGLAIVCPVKDYIEDPESLNWGLLLRWRNPFYRFPGPAIWSEVYGASFSTLQRIEGAIARRRP